MKIIQWYPGHMAKAVRMIEENLTLCDAVLFVLDARAPASTYNPVLKRIVKDKPVLFLLNKRDLADGGAEGLAEKMRMSGTPALSISAMGDSRALQNAMTVLVKEKTERLKMKGSSRPIRFFVAGIPNTGKSSVINLLSGDKRAKTGDKAGVTRNKQWVKCGAFELLDTPGLMPPSLENQIFARRLACLGCVNDDILEMDEVALALLEELSVRYPDRLKERYAIEKGEPLAMLEGVCSRRGFILKGKEFDYERGERAVIDDFRKGRLGKILLDSEEDLREAGLIHG